MGKNILTNQTSLMAKKDISNLISLEAMVISQENEQMVLALDMLDSSVGCIDVLQRKGKKIVILPGL